MNKDLTLKELLDLKRILDEQLTQDIDSRIEKFKEMTGCEVSSIAVSRPRRCLGYSDRLFYDDNDRFTVVDTTIQVASGFDEITVLDKQRA